MNTSGIGGIIGGIIAAGLLELVASHADKNAKRDGGKMILRYGKSARALGWLVVLMCLFIVYAASDASDSQRVMAGCVGFGFIAIAVVLLLELYFVKILFDKEFIYTVSPWRPARKIPWAAVSGYAYSNINQWHILKTTSYGNIRLSILLSGLGTLAEELRKRKIRFGKSSA